MRMTFYRIVEHLDKIEYLCLSLFPCRIYLPFQNSFFECCEKALSNRIIITRLIASNLNSFEYFFLAAIFISSFENYLLTGLYKSIRPRHLTVIKVAITQANPINSSYGDMAFDKA